MLVIRSRLKTQIDAFHNEPTTLTYQRSQVRVLSRPSQNATAPSRAIRRPGAVSCRVTAACAWRRPINELARLKAGFFSCTSHQLPPASEIEFFRYVNEGRPAWEIIATARAATVIVALAAGAARETGLSQRLFLLTAPRRSGSEHFWRTVWVMSFLIGPFLVRLGREASNPWREPIADGREIDWGEPPQ
jgi:hypothetical protein